MPACRACSNKCVAPALWPAQGRPLLRRGNLDGRRSGECRAACVVSRGIGGIHNAAGKNARGYAAHSLRAGLITQAAMAGVSERAIQDQSGHKSLAVMRRYIRDGSLFRENAAAKVGL